ncbi:MAG TPA: SdpI family protein [Bacilli bacterium]|jgi:uncharacterized membrane protein|nr:SdpI family protein [Acholeplasmataceae bacterium]HOE78074.1 SdpI family protein [Bacilli bacterium]HPD12449.1 SdpI family protein [Bacilli bacterium]HRS30936.1 SdpI family protein [Bacilli bacterium]HRU49284.1 SdpI family protein [Bacilli bacterium]
MGFWRLMFLMDLLIPLLMIIYGYVYSQRAPKKINYFSGYRTRRSMQNKETWDFAHRYFGRLSLVFGLVLMPLTIIAALTFRNTDVETVGIMGTLLMTGQIVFLIILIIPTEIALKKNFDKDGNRRTDR